MKTILVTILGCVLLSYGWFRTSLLFTFFFGFSPESRICVRQGSKGPEHLLITQSVNRAFPLVILYAITLWLFVW